MKKAPVASPQAHPLRQRAEDGLREQRGLAEAPRSKTDARALLHELQVHQIELELQNEELRLAQAEAQQAADKYSELFDFAPLGYFVLDPLGIIRELNLAGAALLGLDRRRATGQPFRKFLAGDSHAEFDACCGGVQPGEGRRSCELRLLRPERGPCDVLVEVSRAEGGAGGNQGCRLAVTDISGRKQAEEGLKVSLGEKEALLKEVHHRVKNNLQIIASLVNLQAEVVHDPTLIGLFQNLRDRVRSIALVHETLYQAESLARLDFGEYARSLLNYLWRSHGSAAQGIRLKLDVQPVTLSTEAAVPCGLILNELAGNAIEHAFAGRPTGEVTVALKRDAATHQVCLLVSDNGTGLPAGLDWRRTSTLGLRLVQMLTQQLRGAVEVGGGAGTKFRVTFTTPAEP